jgi:uncharacterized membrane protein
MGEIPMLKRTMIPLLLVVGLPSALSAQEHKEHHPAAEEGAAARAMGSGEGMMEGMKMEGMEMEGMKMEGMKMEGMEMDGMEMDGMKMDGMGMSSPKMLLKHGEALSLTPEQVADLEALQSDLSESRTSWKELAEAARERAAASLEAATPDLSAYEEALIEAETNLGRVRASVAVAAARAKALLTPEQREKLEDHCGLMGSMTDQGMGGSMMEGKQEGHAHDEGGCN